MPSEIIRARVVVGRVDEQDTLDVHIESEAGNVETERVSATVRQTLKLRGRIHVEPVGSLPNDGKVIDDQRHYDGV